MQMMFERLHLYFYNRFFRFAFLNDIKVMEVAPAQPKSSFQFVCKQFSHFSHAAS